MTKTVETDTSGIVGTLHVYSNNENKTEGHTQTHWSLFCLCENVRDDYDKIFLDEKPWISEVGTHVSEETSAIWLE